MKKKFLDYMCTYLFFIKKHFALLFVCLVSVSFFSFGFHHLTKFETADEAYWIQERIPQYWESIFEHKWKYTFINDKPGVSLAIFSGAALLFNDDTVYYRTISKELDGNTKQLSPEVSERIFFYFRLPLLIVNTFLIFYFYWAIQKIFSNKLISLGTVTGIGLSPILIGISQIVNPDALLWSFGFATFLSFIIFLKKSKRPRFKYILLTSLFFSLCLVTKYTILIFLPLFVVMPLLYVFLDPEARAKSADQRARMLSSNAFGTIIIFSITAICTSILIPAIAASPHRIIKLATSFSDNAAIMIILSITVLVIFSFTRSSWIKLIERTDIIWKFLIRVSFLFLFVVTSFLLISRHFCDLSIVERAPIDIKYVDDIEGWNDLNVIGKSVSSILLQYNKLVFSLPIIILIPLLMFWFYFGTRKRFYYKYAFPGTAASVIFILVPLGYAVEGLYAIVRYLILLYPVAAFLAALGVEGTIGSFPKNKKTLFVWRGVFVFSILSLFASVLGSSPFYFNYTNSILPKNKIIHDAWGYGGYEAAQYINSQEDGRDIVVWADYDGVCPFINGTCIINYRFDKKRYPVDYYVFSRRGKIRFSGTSKVGENLVDADKFYNEKPQWELHILGRDKNFISVVKAE